MARQRRPEPLGSALITIKTMSLKSFIYLTFSLISLIILIMNPDYVAPDSDSKLNLCNLTEGQRGSVTGIITEINTLPKYQSTIVDPQTGCSAIVIGKEIDVPLQEGITFTALVQAGFLKLPTNIVYENNLGKVKYYQEIKNYIRTKPRNIREKNMLVIDLYDSNGKRIPLYISKSMAKQIKYNNYNTFYYDKNRKVRQVVN